MLSCLIVDDEPLAIEVIESHLEKIDNIRIAATCPNAIKAFEILQREKIDLLFLDIQMPKLTGLEFLKTIKNPPKVILTTAYRDYALDGYELDVVDYLLKPISFERFLKAIGKVYDMKEEPESVQESDELSQDHSIFLKADKKMVKILLKDILYIESLKDYVRVKTPQKEIISYQKISYLEEILPHEMFIRIHRSFIVAIDKIEAFSSSSIELPGKNLPIGRLYKNQVQAKLSSKSKVGF
jgi:DNA-binding LytR/AlgR family response regulator